jgi:hypothetical protein
LNISEGKGGSFDFLALSSFLKELLPVDRLVNFPDSPPVVGRGSSGRSPRDGIFEGNGGNPDNEEDAEGEEGDNGFSC